MPRFSDTIYLGKTPVVGAELRVFNQDGTPASLTNDAGHDLLGVAVSGAFGNVHFHANDGIYIAEVYYQGRLRYRIDNLAVGDGAPGNALSAALKAADTAQAALAGTIAIGNYRVTRAQGVADFAVGEFFTSDETGTLRAYRRIAAAPGYVDMGDSAAPATLASAGPFVSLLKFIPYAQHSAILGNTSNWDASAALQAAVDSGERINIPNGRYLIDATIRERTNSGARCIVGSNRHRTALRAGPNVSAAGAPLFWFGNSTGHGNYRLWMEGFFIEGGDSATWKAVAGTAGNGDAGAIGVRLHECGTSFLGNFHIRGCYTAVEMIGSMACQIGGFKSEIYASRYGIKMSSPVGRGSNPPPASLDDILNTGSPPTLNGNANRIENIWTSGLGQIAYVKGGLCDINNIVSQSCGRDGLDVIHLQNSNESYSFGDGPVVRNIWMEGGSGYRSLIHVESTRNAAVERCFISGSNSAASTYGEQGILVTDSKGVTVRGNGIRGYFGPTPSEGRTSCNGLYVDPLSRGGVFGPNFFADNQTTPYIDRSSATHNHVIIDNNRSSLSSKGMVVGAMRLSGAVLEKDPDLTVAANVYMKDLRYLGKMRVETSGGVNGTVNADVSYEVNNVKVLGARGAAVPDATGGTTVDAEARTAINGLLAALRTHGLIAP